MSHVGRRRWETELIHDPRGFSPNPPTPKAYHTVKSGIQKELVAPKRIQKQFYPTVIFVKPLPSQAQPQHVCPNEQLRR
jgi:hypothetical protein